MKVGPESLLEDERLTEKKPLAILYAMYRGNFSKIILSMLFFMVKHSPIWVLPIITARFINFASSPGEHHLMDLWPEMLILLIILVQNIPMHSLYVSYMSKAIRYVEADLRSTLIRKLQRLSMSYHGDLKAGKMQAKVLRDVEAIEFLSRQLMVSVLPALINVIVTVIITINYNVPVSLFFILTVPVSFLIVAAFRRKMGVTNREFRKEIESMSGKVSEMMEMIPVTRAHGLEKVEISRIDRTLQNLRGKGYKLDILEAFFGSSNWVTIQIFQVACLIFTAGLAFKGQIPVGYIVMFQGFFSTIMMSVLQILNVYPNIAKGLESIYSVTEIVFSKDTEEYVGTKKLQPVRGQVTFEDVHFSYRSSDKHVLRNFALEVRAGECIALIGESGAGKSTILNLIIGFYKPTQGQIRIDGVPLEELDIQEYRKSLAVVLQTNILFSGTIRENITYGLQGITDEKLWEVIDMTNLRDVIEALPSGVDTLIGEHGGKLSGGQRQRIAIARALIRDPRIIILDEATSALDNKSEHHVQTAMKRLIEGRTTFIVAHRLSTIRDADRIVVMNRGRISEVGTYDELMDSRGEFYNLKAIQA
ncbi:ABC transporter ATP-binding protein [Paenibacillus athensensis]|uniref:ABC transporter n=1 Tax=Paenibacillus athensensis TaxID=1967502 RepID=A0A4Y8Q0J4_9BACL|nr:ABC transporter ATP-binding protein [Paenibacillus athensensis]MCD1258315.1 ABC transporter ATP-binding protein [Paenibacillus athensensis]